ncbi:MAG: hypothetical protein IJ309_06540 [Clostridia bacterium]|nr:hypothetical protein [Clostridia bacterium]
MRRNRYERSNNRGSVYGGGYNNSTHADHTARDTWYAILACIGVLGFGAIWVGLLVGSLPTFLVGCVLSLILVITSIVSFAKAIRSRASYH